jgi:hypothetical protein
VSDSVSCIKNHESYPQIKLVRLVYLFEVSLGTIFAGHFLTTYVKFAGLSTGNEFKFDWEHNVHGDIVSGHNKRPTWNEVF